MEENTGAMRAASLLQAPSEKPPLSSLGTLQPLCYEHHLEMRLIQVPQRTGSEPAQTLVHACPERNCFVHYDSSRGYFIVTDNGNGIDQGTMPEVWCSQDGLPMYLAEVLQAQRSFRLWRCPKCNLSRRNNDEFSQAPAA
jgi:hypothetical protein